jgi:hypothetical protein
VYEATDEGITSFRKVSKSKGIMADASSDRGAVGMHITHSTRTTDEGDVVNVHRCSTSIMDPNIFAVCALDQLIPSNPPPFHSHSPSRHDLFFPVPVFRSTHMPCLCLQGRCDTAG